MATSKKMLCQVVDDTAGTTSAYVCTVSDTAVALLADPDAANMRGTMGLDESSTLPVGTTAGTIAAGDHTHQGGSAAWGGITGTLSDQTDLQTALNGKAASLGVDDNYVTDAEKVVIGNTSGTNTGDQTLIVGITGTIAQFNTACTDANFAVDGAAPTAHAISHKSGGTDAIKLDELAAPTGSVGFNGQQATSFRIENRTSDPISPTAGQVWLRTDL